MAKKKAIYEKIDKANESKKKIKEKR